MKVLKDGGLQDMLLCAGELLQNAAASTYRPEIFLLQAAWGRSSGDYRDYLVEGIKQCENEGARVVHSVMSEGNDDVEDFLLEGLGLTSFPAFLKVSVNESKVSISYLDSLKWKILAVGKEAFPSSIVADYEKNFVKKLFEDEDDVGLLFVSGDRSGVGKTSCCLGLLAYLADVCGVSSDDLGYIKPVTQCEAEQPIIKYCGEKGIECVGIGPVVFYKGFTRAFLAGETPNSQELVTEATNAVMNIKRRRKFVLVDGVGYPAVGSICGISNAHTAAALKAPVLIIGKSGVGDAVDSHNLNSTFFEHHGVTVLGAIFNKMATSGYYDMQSCSASIDSYFKQYRKDQIVFGYLPELELKNVNGSNSNLNKGISGAGTQLSHVLGDAFKGANSRVLMPSLLRSISIHQKIIRNSSDSQSFVHELRGHLKGTPRGVRQTRRRDHPPPVNAYVDAIEMDVDSFDRTSRKRKAYAAADDGSSPPAVRQSIRPGLNGNIDGTSSTSSRSSRGGKSRAEIESEAKSKGASGG